MVNGEATNEVLEMIAEIVKYRHPDFACALKSPARINDLFDSLGKLIPDVYKQKPMSKDLPLVPALCADDDALAQFYENQCILMSQKGPLTEELCNKLLDDMQNRIKDAVGPLASLAQQEHLELPPIFADDPCNPGSWSAGLIPRNDPTVMAAAASATKASMDTIENSLNRDLTGRHGLLNMILAAKNGRGLEQHYNRLTNSPNLTRNKFPDQVAGHLKNILNGDAAPESGEFIDFETTSNFEFRSRHWGADTQREFFVAQRLASMGSKVYPTTALGEGKFDIGWQQKREGLLFIGADPLPEGYNPEPNISFKEPDLKMSFQDYKTDQPYQFNLEYHNFSKSHNGLGPSTLNDYYKILITHKAEDKSNPDDEKDMVWYEGYEGEQLTEEEIRDMMLEVETEDVSAEGALDIELRLADGLSPKNSLYAKMIRSSFDRYPLGDATTIAAMGPLPEKTIDAAAEDELFDNFYRNYDSVFKGFLQQYAKSVSGNSRAFNHGMSKYYRGALDEDIDDLVKTSEKNADDPPEDMNDLSPEEIATLLGMPIKVDLSGSYTDLDGVSWQIPTEVYGGVAERPSWYYQPPTYTGWMGIKQALIPEEIYTGCDAPRTTMVDFENITETINDLYERLPDDPRLQSKEGCTMEHPWNKALDRYSTAGLEGSIRATCRVYAFEAMITSISTTTRYKAKFPDVYDDMIVDKIIDSMESGMLELSQKKQRRKPMKYYLTFLEQVVQCFGKRIDLGDFEPTGLEQEAIDRLTGKAGTKANPLNQWHWEKNEYPRISRQSYPGQVASGIMAAVGSKASPAPGVASSMIAAAGSKAAAKKLQRTIWKRYLSDPNNMRDSKLLLRRYVKEEMEYVAERFDESNLAAPIDSLHNEFLANPDWIVGALGTNGPANVAAAYVDGNMDDINLVTSVQYYLEETAPDTTDFWNDESYRPFILEKYIKINEVQNWELRDPNHEGKYFSLTDVDKARFNRLSEPEFKGVVNLGQWSSWLEDNSDLFEDAVISDFFESWEFGLRISHIAAEGATPWSGAATSEQDFWNLYSSSFLDADQLNQLSLYNKAFWLPGWSGLGPGRWIIPLCKTEKEIDQEQDINLFISSDIESTSEQLASGYYDDELDCLVDDLTKTASYRMMFGFIFPLPRILSILTIYNMSAFLPSIGSAEADDWETRVFGLDADSGGGKWLGAGKFGGFRTWDWTNLFKKAKRQCWRVFMAFYHASDFDYSSPEKDKAGKINKKLNIDISWNFLGLLRRKQIKDPFNTSGQPCPLVDEEEG